MIPPVPLRRCLAPMFYNARVLRQFLLLAMLLALPALPSDWPGAGGDPQRARWQKEEKLLTPASVKGLKLLWKLQLDNQSRGFDSLTAPLIVGPIITHRGVKELVFVAGSSDTFYAVDIDLGRLLWQRHLERDAAPAASSGPCNGALTATPVMPPARGRNGADDPNEDPAPMRPLYVLASDGRLHALRASTGVDIGSPLPFLPANARASSLLLAGDTVYTTTAGGCGGARDGAWGIHVGPGQTHLGFFDSAADGAPLAAASVGLGGNIYAAFARALLSLAPISLTRGSALLADPTDVAPVPFAGQEGERIAAVSRDGRLVLLDPARPGQPVASVAATGVRGSLATWQDAGGARWIYAVAGDTLTAFRLDREGRGLTRAWTSRRLDAPLAPVVVNGVLFVLAAGAQSRRAVLYAFDATAGRELYSSGNAVTAPVDSSGLAVANGHVCFGTADNVLYCFGLPMEM